VTRAATADARKTVISRAEQDSGAVHASQAGSMMTSPESHARHVLSTITRDGSQAPVEPSLLQRLIALIADDIQKAVWEDREELRTRMSCDPREPCGFQQVCSYHKALAGAILSSAH
jgi:hypothetical protein